MFIKWRAPPLVKQKISINLNKVAGTRIFFKITPKTMEILAVRNRYSFWDRKGAPSYEADLVLIHISGKAERLWGRIGSKEKVAQVFNLCNL
jgi:hypothetical protein